MACQAIHSWTLSSLVGAFLDLSLAYLMLCGSALAFLASKFLGIFGLHLPCPCGGLFGNPRGNNCLQGALVDYPPRTIASVQTSLRRRFPFDSIWAGEGLFVRREGRASDDDDGLLEMEESCGSVSTNVLPRLKYLKMEEDDDVLLSSSVVLSSKPRSGPRRRRRRRVASDRIRSSSVSEENSAPGCHRRIPDNVDADTTASVGGKVPNFISNWPDSELKDVGTPGVQELDRNEANIVRILEQALEEEQAARSALYAELEKERSAAASAADEAMAMISRLQKEKASIEMEARQYQRMIEEKSAYDEEEMDILKEIIVMREREKYVLEKEVEMCRQMKLSGVMDKQQPGDKLSEVLHMMEQQANSPSGSTDDTSLMLQKICESIGKKQTISNGTGYSETTLSVMEKQNSSGGYGRENPELGSPTETCFLEPGVVEAAHTPDKHHLEAPDCIDESTMDFQEKGIVSVNLCPFPVQFQMSSYENGGDSYKFNVSQGPQLQKKTSFSDNKDNRDMDSIFGVKLPYGHTGCVNDQCITEKGFDSCTSQLEPESIVHDVHVIDDKLKLCGEGNGEETVLQVGSTSVESKKDDLPSELDEIRNVGISLDSSNIAICEEVEPKIRKSFSDMTGIILSNDSSHYKAPLYILGRNSMSAVDSERLKLRTEVDCLRERLKVVQQGRDKLNISADYREKEILQLQLLEEIALQLQEIRQLNEPGKAIRQASLPPPSSKVNSKKRRCQSVSLGVHGSSLNH